MKPSDGPSLPARNDRFKWYAFMPAVLWLIVITYLSTMPGVSLPAFNLIATDKLAHAGVYGVQTWLVLYGIGKAWGRAGTGFAYGASAFAIATAYGVLMEFVQFWFFPGRFYEYDDMLANAIGAGIGWALFRLWRK